MTHLSRIPESASQNPRIARFVLAVGLAITATATFYMKLSVGKTAEQEFNAHCAEIQAAIADRLEDHARILLSGAALFNAFESVTRENWHNYAQSQKLEKQLHGIQGIGFSLLIPRAELARHIQEIRNEGFPEYKIRPEGERELYSSVIYLEPFAGRNLRAFGYDMLPEPVRRLAMETARDTDEAALSGKITLVQETETNVQAGALMYVPVYRKGMPTGSVEQRRAAIYGWVYSPYRMNDLIQGILGDSTLEQKKIHLSVYDGEHPSPQSLLYDCHFAANEPLWPAVRFVRQMPVDFNGHRWTLSFQQTNGNYFTTEYTKVWLTLIGDALITLLLFALIRVLQNTRLEAQRIAEKLTIDLKQSEDKYRMVADNASDWVTWIAPDNTFRYISPSCEQITGHTPAEFMVDPSLLVKITHPDDREKVNEHYFTGTHESKGHVLKFDFRIIAPMGEIRWLSHSCTAVYGDAGQWLGRRASCRDITERKRAEAALRENQALLESIINGTTDAVFVKDLKGVYQLFNEAAARYVGKTVKEVLGKNDYFLFPADEAKTIMADDQKVIDGNSAVTYEEAVTFADGKVANLLSTKGPVFDANGRKIGLFGIARDISALKKAEIEQLKMQKLQSVGTLAGGIAHDFNNILMGLFGNISLAKNELPKDQPAFKSLEDAEKSMSRAIRLTKQLLTFAKGGDPIKEDVSLGALVEEAARFDLSGSNVMLVYKQAGDLWPAKADKGQVQQAVSNLTLNAIQAMPTGGHLYITLENAEIQAETLPSLQPGKYVRITVRDEGTGIDPKCIGRIFDPYFTTKEAGRGLGLATTYSIITKHGGHIGVESEPGKGSAFTIYLPASDSPLPLPFQDPVTALPALKPATKILVLDDEEFIRMVISRWLQPLGCVVETTEDGRQAIAMYKKSLETGTPFDVVILDLTIPGGMGGLEVVKELLVINPNLKAIVSSGYAEGPVMSRFAFYGFKNVLTKPYTETQLQEIVGAVLRPTEADRDRPID